MPKSMPVVSCGAAATTCVCTTAQASQPLLFVCFLKLGLFQLIVDAHKALRPDDHLCEELDWLGTLVRSPVIDGGVGEMMRAPFWCSSAHMQRFKISIKMWLAAEHSLRACST